MLSRDAWAVAARDARLFAARDADALFVAVRDVVALRADRPTLVPVWTAVPAIVARPPTDAVLGRAETPERRADALPVDDAAPARELRPDADVDVDVEVDVAAFSRVAPSPAPRDAVPRDDVVVRDVTPECDVSEPVRTLRDVTEFSVAELLFLVVAAVFTTVSRRAVARDWVAELSREFAAPDVTADASADGTACETAATSVIPTDAEKTNAKIHAKNFFITMHIIAQMHHTNLEQNVQFESNL